MVFSEQKLYFFALCASVLGFSLLLILSLTLPPKTLSSSLELAPENQVLVFKATITDLQTFPSGSTMVSFTRIIAESGFLDTAINESLLDQQVDLTGIKNDDFFTITSVKTLPKSR